MVLKEVLPPSEIFDSRSFYDGEWALNGVENDQYTDYLAINAKIENGNNLYMQFLQKYYFQPLCELFRISNPNYFHPVLVFGDDKKSGKRKLSFSVHKFLVQILHTVMDYNADKIRDVFDSKYSDKELVDFVRDKLRIDMRKYIDVQKKGKSSEFYKQVYDYFLVYIGRMKENGLKMNISFEKFLMIRIDGDSKTLNGVRYYKDVFEKNINFADLVNCFDYDKFCLTIAKTNLQTCLEFEQLKGRVSNIIHFLQMYSLSVQVLKKDNPSYNCVIKYPTENGKILEYSSDELVKEYNAFLARHPEFSFTYVDVRECVKKLKEMGFDDSFISNFDPSTAEGRKIVEVLIDADKGEEASADWVFIRRGNFTDGDKVDDHNKGGEYSHYPHPQLPEDEVIRRMLLCRDYLQNSSWLYRVYGIKKFEGYEGFIYSNGRVIFEKFYENIETKEVARDSATYIMNIYNFIELSQLNKSEIIRIINNSNNPGVRRVYHTKNINAWMAKVNSYITDGYNEDVIRHVDGLIESGVLHKDGGGKKNGNN